MNVRFELYTREGCHLCEEMEQEIVNLESQYKFSTQLIVINDNAALEERYGDKVPVLARGKTIICQYVINEEALSTAIKQNK